MVDLRVGEEHAGHRRGANAVRAFAGEHLELLAQVRRRVGEEPRALGAADRDRRLRPRRRRAPAGRLAGRAAAVPLREAAAGGGAEDMNAHRPMIETGDDLRTPTPVNPRRGMNVEVTAAGPTEVEADTLALVAGSLLVRKLDALFEGRLARVGGRRRPDHGRPGRPRAARAADRPRRDGRGRPGGPADRGGPGRSRAAAGPRRVAWALDDTLPMAETRQMQAIVEGAVLGSYDAGRWKSEPGKPAVERFVVCGAGDELRGGREPARGRRALDERRPRARRRAAERRRADRSHRSRRHDPRPARRGSRRGRRRPPGARRRRPVEHRAAAARRPAPRARRRAPARRGSRSWARP